MYVCLCKGITERQIHRAIDEGACSMRDLRQQLGIATQCGRCGKCARTILKAHGVSHSLGLLPPDGSTGIALPA